VNAFNRHIDVEKSVIRQAGLVYAGKCGFGSSELQVKDIPSKPGKLKADYNNIEVAFEFTLATPFTTQVKMRSSPTIDNPTDVEFTSDVVIAEVAHAYVFRRGADSPIAVLTPNSTGNEWSVETSLTTTANKRTEISGSFEDRFRGFVEFNCATAWTMFEDHFRYDKSIEDVLDSGMATIANHARASGGELSPEMLADQRVQVETKLRYMPTTVAAQFRSGAPEVRTDFLDNCRRGAYRDAGVREN
jgi:hypothetical protein